MHRSHALANATITFEIGIAMVQIVVTPEQAKVLADAMDSVEIVDAHGNRLGFFARPFSEQEIATARARASSDAPRSSTQQVIGRLKSLEQE